MIEVVHPRFLPLSTRIYPRFRELSAIVNPYPLIRTRVVLMTKIPLHRLGFHMQFLLEMKLFTSC